MPTAGLALRDYERVLPVIDRIVCCDSPGALAELIVHEVAGLIPTFACGWVDIHLESGFSHGVMNVPVDPAVVAREMSEVISRHPVFRVFLRTRDGRARAISDLVSRRTYRASDVYTKFLKKYGAEDQLIVADAIEPNRITVLTLNRHTWGFSDAEKAVLNALRPALFQTYRRLRQLDEFILARDGVHWREQARPTMIAALLAKGLTRREAEVTAMMAEGASNRRISEQLRISEGTVRKHVDRVFLKLDVHNRAAATRVALGLLGCADRRPNQTGATVPFSVWRGIT